MRPLSELLQDGIKAVRLIRSIPPTHRPTVYTVEGTTTTVRPHADFTIYAFTRTYWETISEEALFLVTNDGLFFPLDVRDVPLINNRVPLIGEYVDRLCGRQPKHAQLEDERLNDGSYAAVSFKRSLMRIPEKLLPTDKRDHLITALNTTQSQVRAQTSPVGVGDAFKRLLAARIEQWSALHPADSQRRTVTAWFNAKDHLIAFGLSWRSSQRFEAPMHHLVLVGGQRYRGVKAESLLNTTTLTNMRYVHA